MIDATVLIHPAADAFPMLPDDEINALAVDIVQNGLIDPVVLNTAGEIIDGRNRMEACRRVNVEPDFVTYDGDPWAYSRSVNLWRRNLTTGQRAASCAISLIAEGKRRDGRWVRGSVPGDETGGDKRHLSLISEGWKRAMLRAGTVADWSNDQDLLLAVREGEMALDAAYQQAKARREKAEWEADQAAKAAQREIALCEAAQVRIIRLMHEVLEEDLDAMDGSEDLDNWKILDGLADRIIKTCTHIKEKANAQLHQ
jgi:hypothetical protein